MRKKPALPGLIKYPDLHASAVAELSKAGCCGSRQNIIRKYMKKSQERDKHVEITTRSIPSVARRHKLI